MARRHARDPEKEQFWRWILEEHQKSGLNIREFCKREELSEACFYAWRREIRRRDESEHVSIRSANGDSNQKNGKSRRVGSERRSKKRGPNPPEGSNQPSDESSLLPVVVSSSGNGQQSVPDKAIEIETPSGFTVRLGQSTDPQTVAQLLTEIHRLDRAGKEV